MLIVGALGTVFWCRVRKRRRIQGLSISRNEEEHIPLTQDMPTSEPLDTEPLDTSEFRTRKGKERARETGATAIFDVGDSDEESDRPTH